MRISKYHLWYLCQRPLQIMLLPILIYAIIISKTEVNFTLLLRIRLKGNFKCTYLWNSLSTWFGRVRLFLPYSQTWRRMTFKKQWHATTNISETHARTYKFRPCIQTAQNLCLIQTQIVLNNSLTKEVPSHWNKWAVTSWFADSFW